MNTLQKISVTLPLAILVVVACDSIVGPAPVKAQAGPAVAPAVVIPHPDTFLLVEWEIKAIQYCPQSRPYPIMPKVGDKYKIDKVNNKYTITKVTGSGMDDWTRLNLEYNDRDRKRRPKGHNIIANRQPRCDLGPSYFADRIIGCSDPAVGKQAHCFHIDFVENSLLHPNEEWSPYITYVEDGQHNGIIH